MSSDKIKINYIELKSSNLKETKTFYSKLFGWEFTDYGENYTAFSGAGIEGGFEYTTDPIVNGVLIVLAHNDLESILSNIQNNGSKITVPIFSFPGGRRFQFLDPSGNELAVWCEEA